MSGHLNVFRRAAVGVPLSQVGGIMDARQLGPFGSKLPGVNSSVVAATSIAGVTVASSGSTNTRGTAVELIASTAFDAETLVVNVHGATNTSGALSSLLLTIVTGPSQNVDLVANLQVGFAPGLFQTFYIPIAIPAGTRISAQCQSGTASKACVVSAHVRAAGDHSTVPTSCTTIGVNTATSFGTACTTAGTINTKGAWAQMTASTAAAYNRMLITLQGNGSTIVAATGSIDIGVGGAGSESVIIADIPFEQSTTEQIWGYGFGVPFAVNIPAGSRIAARYQSTSNAANNAPVLALHCLR